MAKARRHDIEWNTIILREFETLACLSEEERIVLYDWAYDRYLAHTHTTHGMCETKIKEIRSRIRRKYDAVQPFSPLLPPRLH